MEKADSDFLHQLFRENSHLKSQITMLHRQLHNKTTQLETATEENDELKVKLDKEVHKLQVLKHASSRELTRQSEHNLKQAGTDFEENTFLIEAQKLEIAKLNGEVERLKLELTESIEQNNAKTEEIAALSDKLLDMDVLSKKVDEFTQERDQRLAESLSSPSEVNAYKVQLKEAESRENMMRKQLIVLANDASRIHNEQQNQLQGFEMLIEKITREYEEFIKITRIENEAFKSQQQEEYEKLKKTFEIHKDSSFEEKKNIMIDYQNILIAMQSQFEEYRAVSELLFNSDILKLEEELTSQATRYEQEILYVIQSKDKFYSDLIVAKDAKIMGLIEGSDLQCIMQRHELDIDNLRKEHQKEIERVKSDHDTESKNVILLLQRQNVSLEAKAEKIQTHMKTLEAQIKELMSAIESKNKLIADKEDAKLKMEADYQKKLYEANEKISKLTQDKEHLRHKIIRLNLDAKGEGENSIENMLKRLTKDTTDLKVEFDAMEAKYTASLCENQELSKKIKEKDRNAEFLEKEITRQGREFTELTQTFEEFLSARLKQHKRARIGKLATIPTKEDASGSKKLKLELGGKPNIIKAEIPENNYPTAPKSKVEKGQIGELERGLVYLKRFKNLSKAFASGDFRAFPNNRHTAESIPGPWQKTPLYAKLDEASVSLAKVYRNEVEHVSPSYYATAHANNAVKIYTEQKVDKRDTEKSKNTPKHVEFVIGHGK